MAIQPVDDGSDQGDDPTAITKISKPTAPVAAPTSSLTPQAPTPSAQSPLPLTAVQQPAPVSASDPLAFSGGPAAPPTMTTQQFDNFSPLSGLSEAQKTAYWAGQGAQGLSGVGYTPPPITSPGVTGGTQQDYDPAANAAATQAYKANNADEIAKITQQVQGNQAGALQAVNAGQSALNDTQASKDYQGYRDTLRGTPGANIAQAPSESDWRSSNGLQPMAAPALVPSRSLTPGAANDAGTPSSGAGASLPLSAIPQTAPGATTGAPGATSSQASPPASPQTTSTPSASGAAGAGGTGGNAVNLTPTDANNPLTAQTISAGPGLDRFKIAQDEFDNFQRSSDPAYQASLRDATRSGFGAGRGVSGQLRTTLGDFAQNRDTQLDTQRKSLLNNALLGTIDDGYRNLGIAQQQQGFQAGQQQQAFGNSVTQAQLQDALINSAFGRAQGQEQAGYANDPSNIALILSQIFGQQATGAGQAAAGLFNQAGQGTNNQNNAILQYLLNALGGSGGAGNAPADASGGTPGYPGVN